MKKIFILWLLIMSHAQLFSQSCSINAGGNLTICGTSTTLQATTTGTINGAPVWSLVSKPSGAPDPVIANVNSYNTNVTGMTFPGNYVFSVSQPCTTGTSSSQVTINAPGDVSTFTAGSDITTVSALTGVANLNATIPAGYTASWTYYNLNSYEFNGAVITTNATMTGTTTATPTLTLTKKADHDIDPVYRAVLRITSTNNPSCWYEDNAIVRFIPNPNVSFPNNRNQCGSMSTIASNRYFYDTNSSSPKFSDNTANASANPAFGTTITMNVISQPVGGNLAYDRIQNGRIYFTPSFNQTPGAYVFTLTVTNANGTYTTPNLTYNYNGSQPEALSFLDAAYPEQMELYTAGNSGGAVYCNRAGTTAPITFYFKIDPADPATLTSTVTATGIIPEGGAPSIVVNGAGTRNRSATLTPPAGGWRVGTYKFSVSVGNGTCSVSRLYYVHISDGNRPDVEVENMTVCYPGSGVVSATIPLPVVYKGVVAPSYFQDFNGRYELTVISRPAGSAVPVFQPVEFREITDISTIISNLNMQGEYRFRIRAVPPPGGASGFLEKEYACSGTSLEAEFSIFVSTQVNSNAGSNQTLVGVSQATLNGNNPGTLSSGLWTLEEKPVGAPDPVFSDPTLFNTIVSGLTFAGTYRFKWTITTGNCTSEDEVQILADGSFCEGTDSDGDGIPDICDLDDDNDGILDTDECGESNIIKRGNFTTLPSSPGFFNATQFAVATSNNWTFTSTAVGAGSQIFWGNINDVIAFGNGIRFQRDGETQTIKQPLSEWYHYESHQIEISKIAANNSNPTGNSSTLILSYAGVEYVRIVTSNGMNVNATITYSNGASGSITNFAVGTVYNNWIIQLPSNIPSSGELMFSYFAGPADSDDFSIGDIIVKTCQDTDGDGIPDYLDLDSDNDGCLDAIEGDENVTNAQLVDAAPGLSVGFGSTAANQNLCADGSCVDENGVPNLVNSGGAADIGGDQGQGIGGSQDADVNECYCTEDPNTDPADAFTKVGVSTLTSQTSGWPENIPNGWITMESKTQGFVITRVQHVGGGINGAPAPTDSVTDPREGMIVYDIDDACVKLYNGIIWNCIERSCNTPTTN